MKTGESPIAFRYIQSDWLPRLGWVARAIADASEFEVFHGVDVEVHNGFFVEGAWSGKFSAGDIDQVDAFFGSGAVLRGTSVVFVPSCSTVDYLFYGADQSTNFVISNSLASLLSLIGSRLDPNFPTYHLLNESIWKGIYSYDPTIPTTERPVFRLMHHNLTWNAGRITKSEKPAAPPFRNYSEYRGYLESTCINLLSNARDSARTKPLTIFTTQSRGYDTTAVNAIASKCGIDLALTVTTSKIFGQHATPTSGDGESDDGSEICAALRMPVATMERRSFLSGSDDEILFHAGCHSCQDGNLLDLKRHLRGPTVLLTGTFGELWCTDDWYAENPEETRNGDMRRPNDLGGLGLGEVRLEWGVIHSPLPFIGSRRQEDISAITRSSEMDPWRLRGSYDRPIARRIAEEAGVPRQLFGQKKLASVVMLPVPYFPVSPALRQDYTDWLVENRLVGKSALKFYPLVLKYNAALAFKSFPRYKWIYYFERAIFRLTRRKFAFPRIWSHLTASLYCFAVNTTADRRTELRKRETSTTSPNQQPSSGIGCPKPERVAESMMSKGNTGD